MLIFKWNAYSFFLKCIVCRFFASMEMKNTKNKLVKSIERVANLTTHIQTTTTTKISLSGRTKTIVKNRMKGNIIIVTLGKHWKYKKKNPKNIRQEVDSMCNISYINICASYTQTNDIRTHFKIFHNCQWTFVATCTAYLNLSKRCKKRNRRSEQSERCCIIVCKIFIWTKKKKMKFSMIHYHLYHFVQTFKAVAKT